MELTFEEALAFIHGRLKFGNRPGLIRMDAILDKVNHPEKKISTIHIAGTNGKGSTVAFLRSLLMKAELKVGTFISPYIKSFNERISIDKVPIANEKLIEYVKIYQPLIKELDRNEDVKGLTEFELITAIAFSYFYEKKVDVAIIEVGLGGLYDSTNVIKPELTGITTIGYDHQNILGDDLKEIAKQKAGIIKEGIPLVTGNITKKVLSVIEAVACEKKAVMHRYGVDYRAQSLAWKNFWGELFDYKTSTKKLKSLKISMLGAHQVENAAMALKLAEIYLLMKGRFLIEEKIRKALESTFWPARMEKVSKQPLIILDGAHNEHAMHRLVENLKNEFADKKIYILFSALQTKDVKTMLQQLKNLPNTDLYLTSFAYPKAIKLKDISNLQIEGVKIIPSWSKWIKEISSKIKRDEIFLITGSLYFVSQVRKFLKSKRN
ncbi:MAG: bifunctional folylpolyglutamate synthase/dihydrofolate synthase [Streptococcaceae bacterium]|jgi:dihydrofolate synthase/folylpolyglutamate synthase|nr:bifunctional folylpolyglutamate synthase/dihydrofolate synthase [Streptococcaceae bacterium]